MLGKVDFSDAQQFTPVPTDEYKALGESWEAKTDDESRTYIIAKFQIEDGEHVGRSLMIRWYLTKDSKWRMLRDFQTMGVNPDLLTGEAAKEVPVEDILNRLFDGTRRFLLDVIATTYAPKGGGDRRPTNEIRSITVMAG